MVVGTLWQLAYQQICSVIAIGWGFALYASFSMHGDATAFLYNLFSKFSHHLHCRFQTHVAGINDQILVCHTTEEEIIWLLSLGEFIWVSYVPGKPFKDILHHQCSYIKASFGSDWPGVRVQKCALRFLYQHDQVQFKQELRHSISTSWFFEHWDSIC